MKKKIRLLLISICCFIAIGIDPIKFKNVYDSIDKIVFVKDFLNMNYIGSLLLFIFIMQIFTKKEKKSNKVIDFLSIIFSVIMVFGCSYMNYWNASLVFGKFIYFVLAVIMAIGYYYIFRLLLCYLFEYLDKQKIKDCSNKVMLFFKKHPFIVSLVIIILCWLPYIISYYPIILSPDPHWQIKQFFGVRTKYADYSILLDENVFITNHHPVAHTFLLGSCLKIGNMIGNDNLGLFIYSLIQIIALSCTLAYTIKYMLKDMNISNKYGIISLLIYALVPMFPFYAMSGVKDVLFSVFMINYIIMLHRIIRKDGMGFKVWHYVLMILLMLLVILFRNNGLYVIVLSFPFLIWIVRKRWKKYLIIFIITLAFSTCYSKVLLPAFKITPGSIREMLSIPFQQTARYVKYYSDELSDSDKDVIDKVLSIDDLGERYNPELSDPVKEKYNKYTTNQDLMNYFKVWFKGFFKHPVTYINATIDNVYGFFYPEKTNWYLYHNYNSGINDIGFDYHYIDEYEENRDKLYDMGKSFLNIPIIGLISNIGFNTWLVFILVGYVIYKKRYKDIIIYLPALVTILVCVAGPANTYFRYVIPYMFAMPFMISVVFEKIKKV